MQAQSTGAEQINQALVQLGEASSQTVDSLRQAGAAIDELNQVANNLRVGVSRFKVFVQHREPLPQLLVHAPRIEVVENC
jgi:ABC-type transporter Mla subunit MlaD